MKPEHVDRNTMTCYESAGKAMHVAQDLARFANWARRAGDKRAARNWRGVVKRVTACAKELEAGRPGHAFEFQVTAHAACLTLLERRGQRGAL